MSDIAMDAIWESEIARDIVLEVSMAAGKFIASLADLDGPDYANIDEVAGDEDAMDAVSTSQTAMDAVSTSQTAMDAVSVSEIAMEAVAASTIAMDAVIASDDVALPTIVEEEIAMDAVSASDTAMDAIWESSLAWEIVADVAMAVGKFVAGRAGLDGSDYADIDDVASSETAMDSVADSETAMDAVADSETAMDAVADSETAMDAVAGSDTALDAVTAPFPLSIYLTSQYLIDTLWSSESATERFWENGSPEPDSGQDYWEIDIDFTDVDDLIVKTHKDSGTGWDMSIRLDGDTLTSFSSSGDWEERNLDVSSYSGELTLRLQHDDNSDEFTLLEGPNGGYSIGNFENSGEIDGFSDIQLS